MYDKLFKRVETKYVLNKKEQEEFMRRIQSYVQEDKYFKSTIGNLYFDNNNNDLIINSLEKPIFREKVRLRTYGVPNEVFLEIKNKYDGVVRKRRIKLSLDDYYRFLETPSNKIDNQILKEIKYYIDYYKLYPKIYIGYDRVSYQGISDNTLRITFDSNLRSRRNNLKLECGSEGEKYFSDDYYIMEIKAKDALPIWLVNILSDLKIYPQSFSKYGSIYKKEGEI